MSPSISEIGFWKETNKPPPSNGKEGGQGGAYLSYNVFLALSVIGGALALDHLYLRSPLTFLAKLVVNIFTFGAWWLYDASQVVFNRDVVKIFGLAIPGYGPAGIAAGTLASDVPDKKHMAFFVYGLALILGGIFGLDSFILGDKKFGFIRLISLITLIFTPIAIFWWLINLVKFFIKPKDVVERNWEYFGVPEPAEAKLSAVESFISNIPILNKLFSGDGPLGIVEDVLGERAAAALEPLTTTADAAVGVVGNAVGTVKSAVNLGRETVQRVGNIADKTINTVDKVATTGAQALSLGQQASTLADGFTRGAVQKAIGGPQLGGATGDSGVLSYVLMGTFALIAVSGLALTYHRSRQNEQPRKDDAPPEPRVLRKPDQEESAETP
jgi:hypothetical protein